MLDILSQNLGYSDIGDDAARIAVIGEASNILSRIHSSFVTPAEDQDETPQPTEESENAALEDAKRRRVLHALLDLISLEGIYPCLSSGVGIPLQQRVISVLPAGVIAKQTHIPESTSPRHEGVLSDIVGVLLNILLDTRPSIQPVIRGRILSDVVSGTADLGFNPNIAPSEDKVKFKEGFTKIIDEYVHVFYYILHY